MRVWTVALVACLSLGLGACSKEQTESTAHKAGKAAHELADKSEEAAKKAGRELRDAARAAREGWNEAGRKPEQKPKK